MCSFILLLWMDLLYENNKNGDCNNTTCKNLRSIKTSVRQWMSKGLVIKTWSHAGHCVMIAAKETGNKCELSFSFKFMFFSSVMCNLSGHFLRRKLLLKHLLYAKTVGENYLTKVFIYMTRLVYTIIMSWHVKNTVFRNVIMHLDVFIHYREKINKVLEQYSEAWKKQEEHYQKFR